MANEWIDRGWKPPGERGSGSSDAFYDMDRIEDMSTLSASWISVKKDDVDDLHPDDEKGQDLDWMELDDKQDKNDEKGMDMEELAKDKEKGQVSP